MASYNVAYPGLAPLASGADDSPANPIAAGAPLNDGDMSEATRQTKRRRALFDANPRRATEQEVQAAVKREFCVHAENASGAPGQPAWALNLQNQLNDLQNMQRNATTFAPEHYIFPIRNAAGNLPGHNFPADRLGLDNLANAQVTALLGFYNLPPAPQATRLQRLKLHLGIRP